MAYQRVIIGDTGQQLVDKLHNNFTELYNLVGTGGTQVQADWEQDNTIHPSYVLNRPKINEIILRGNRVLPENPLTNLQIQAIISYNRTKKEGI